MAAKFIARRVGVTLLELILALSLSVILLFAVGMALRLYWRSFDVKRTNVEQAHRSTSACEIAWIAMKLGRKTTWDPQQEIFPGDAEANALRARPQRKPYGIEVLLKKA